MTQYKNGDKVRFIGNIQWGDFTPGKEYIVKKVIPDYGYSSGFALFVKEDDAGSTINGWCLNYFEPAYIRHFNNKLEDIINE